MRISAIESLRGFAALYVFAGHLALISFEKGEIWGWPFRFGQEAVMLFFLISGFVIMYSMETSEDKSFSRYLRHRFFRIYPIFLFSLLLSYWLARPDTLLHFAGNLLMLQDFGYAKPGVIVNPFAGNTPLWSLSYEWWFYLMFYPIYQLVAERSRLFLITAAAVIAVIAYNATYWQPLLFLAYFPIWWCGAEIGLAVKRNTPIPFARIFTALAILTATFAIYAVIELLKRDALFFGLHPALELRHAGASLAMVAALFMVRNSFFIEKPNWLLAPFSPFAPISYGIYALHYPIIAAIYPTDMPMAAKLVITILTVFVVAWFAEGPYQRLALRAQFLWKFARARRADKSA